MRWEKSSRVDVLASVKRDLWLIRLAWRVWVLEHEMD